jgi:hypothetical protein
LKHLDKDLSKCYKNCKNQEILQNLALKEKEFKEQHEAMSAELIAGEEPTYFMNSLLLESSLTIILFSYVIRNLWVKLLRSSKNKKVRKEE